MERKITVNADGSFLIGGALNITIDQNHIVDRIIFEVPAMGGTGWAWFVKIQQRGNPGKVLLEQTEDGLLWVVARGHLKAGTAQLQLQGERLEGLEIVVWQSQMVNVECLATIDADTPIVEAETPYLQALDARVAQAVVDAEDSASAADAALNKLVNLDVSAETLAPGSNATVTRTETETGIALAFGIPKGDKGDKGDTGAAGADGQDGADGADGASAYEIAVDNGFEGTELQWLASLVGATGATGETGATGATGAAGADGQDGADGQSAYAAAQAGGYSGTQSAFYADLAAIDGLAEELSEI